MKIIVGEIDTCRHNLPCKLFSINIAESELRVVFCCTLMAMYASHFVNLNEYVFIEDAGKVMKGARFKEEVKHIDTLCHLYTVAIVLSSVGIAIFLTSIASGMEK